MTNTRQMDERNQTPASEEHVLNLGCGADYIEGAVNIDRFATKVDVRHDLNHTPYPFADNEFDEIRCMNVIEHLDDVLAVMHELHRVGRAGCRVIIRVPHFRSACLYEDLTHRHGFAWRSFDLFTEDSSVYGEYTTCRFRILSRAYTPYKLPFVYRMLSRAPVLTDNLLSKYIPMASILFELEVLK
ncbi:MAG TPA: methyltransferase domain-containing protein [Rhodanobacteraceae bacterium]|nr:methyltransferase domain-containing protein [Rhodanobacteraceae bacterium]